MALTPLPPNDDEVEEQAETQIRPALIRDSLIATVLVIIVSMITFLLGDFSGMMQVLLAAATIAGTVVFGLNNRRKNKAIRAMKQERLVSPPPPKPAPTPDPPPKPTSDPPRKEDQPTPQYKPSFQPAYLDGELFRAIVQALAKYLRPNPQEWEQMWDEAFYGEDFHNNILHRADTPRAYAHTVVKKLDREHPRTRADAISLVHYLRVAGGSLGQYAADEFEALCLRIENNAEQRHRTAQQAQAPTTATLNQIIQGYLFELVEHLKYSQQLYVDLEGDKRTLRPASQFDRYLFETYSNALNTRGVQLGADYIVGKDPTLQPVPNVRERLLQLQKGVLLGEPGSGKTWTLIRLVFDHAARCLDETSTFPKRIPIWLPLREFNGTRGEGDAVERQSFQEFITAKAGTLAPFLKVLGEEGRLVLTCDALNEMPRAAPKFGNDLLSDVRGELTKASAFVLSCRSRDFKEDLQPLYPLEQVILRDLTLPQIHELITKRLASLNLGDELWQKMGGSDELLAFWDVAVAEGRTEDFWKANAFDWWQYYQKPGYNAWQTMHRDSRRLLHLSRTPFMTGELCKIYAESRQLPANRVELFRTLVQQSLDREQQRETMQGNRWLGDEPLTATLVELARAMQLLSSTVLPRPAAIELLPTSENPLLRDLLKKTTAEKVLDTLLATGLLIETAGTPPELAFSHQLIQEYFSVRILLEKYPVESAAPLVDPEWWDAKVWRETFVILGEHLGLEPGTVEGANAAVRWLAPATPEIALDCLRRHGAGLTLNHLTDETRETVIASARRKLAEPHPYGRAAAYRVLGLLNADNRPGVSILPQYHLPDIEWCPIPAGDFRYQDGTATIPYDYYIARYPITYQQYQTFIDAKGYQQEEWWKGLQKAGPYDQSFQFSNHPRENITWWESVAFTRWLTRIMQVQAAHILATESLNDNARTVWERLKNGELVVSLPTEEEWEKAARGNDGREYPWEGGYVSGYANIDENPRFGGDRVGDYALGQTSAVGIYFQNKSPYGVMDMVGNVWEWTLSAYEEAEKAIEQKNGWTLHNNQAARVVRGGSWNFALHVARTAVRLGDSPVFRGYLRGCRVVLVPAPTRSAL